MQYAVGTRVATPQGIGVVARFDPESKLYTVTLPDRQVEVPRGEILVQPKPDADADADACSEEPDLPDEAPAAGRHGALDLLQALEWMQAQMRAQTRPQLRIRRQRRCRIR